MSQETAWGHFGPDPAAASLPAGVQACLPPNQPSEACDALIGSAAQGSGFCAAPAYRQTTFCACVNNILGCPEVTSAPCANLATSYKPWAWFQKAPGGQPSRDEVCAKTPICVNLVELGGSASLATGITQQCGAITNLTHLIKANPFLVVLLFVCVALVAAATRHMAAGPAAGRAGPAAGAAAGVVRESA